MLKNQTGCIINVYSDGTNCCAQVVSNDSDRTEHGARCVIDHIIATFKFENNISFRNECYYEFDNQNGPINAAQSTQGSALTHNDDSGRYLARISRPKNVSLQEIRSKLFEIILKHNQDFLVHIV